MSQNNFQSMKFMDKEHFRVLVAIEQGMRTHEIVSVPLIFSMSGAKHYNVNGALAYLQKEKLVKSKRKRQYDGYILTYLGYDYLALHTFTKRATISSIGARIGCGKEADIYLVDNQTQESQMVVKLHHLGRSSFKTLKNNRDFHKNRTHSSWLYISRLSCQAEFEFMKALNSKNLPLPKVHDWNRNAIVMDFIDGFLLTKLKPADCENVDMQSLFDQSLDFLIKLSEFGLVHGDLNEFNIMVKDGKQIFTIDFPQMVSIYSPEAKLYFERDLDGIVSFFSKFNVKIGELPKFEEIECKERLDALTKASGFNNSKHLLASTLEKYRQQQTLDENDTKDILSMFDELDISKDPKDNRIEDDDYDWVDNENCEFDSLSSDPNWIARKVKQELRKKQNCQLKSSIKTTRVNHSKRSIKAGRIKG